MTAQGIIDSLLHLPIQGMRPRLDTRGPYTGNTVLTEDSDGGLVYNSFGLIAVPAIIPLNLSRIVGFVDPTGQYDATYYPDNLAQISVWYNMVFGGVQMAQVDYVHYFYQLMLWDKVGPTFVGLHVLPSVEMELFWLTLP